MRKPVTVKLTMKVRAASSADLAKKLTKLRRAVA